MQIVLAGSMPCRKGFARCGRECAFNRIKQGFSDAPTYSQKKQLKNLLLKFSRAAQFVPAGTQVIARNVSDTSAPARI
jgi:hypothetical protein